MILLSIGATLPALLLALGPQATSELPLLQVTQDDTPITESARILIPHGLVLEDKNGDGVLHVVADGVHLIFEPGSVLRGAPAGQAADRFTGIGVRINGHRDVRLEGLQVAGYKTGVWATNANALRITNTDVSDNFAQRLSSTPDRCDDEADWLECHDNDQNEWMTRYGAGIYVEDSRDVVVRNCRARRTQNGLLLDRVAFAKIYDNDFSFLSGWGLGLWRTSDNMVAHNAFDFCIRGYSHGRYNRGQDSAGILIFEQCSRNTFAYNSATHGGDGVFGFAGKEALGQLAELPDGFDATRKGNNDNIFVYNDFSHAAAHGLEMTFSFGNMLVSNRFAGNAICGIWGGYSQGMRITSNLFEANGDAGYGLERGGINIEHSVNNRIANNQFKDNACGVHLWWDADEGLLATPWAKANDTGCSGNQVIGNRFDGDQVAIELSACQPVVVNGNQMTDVPVELNAQEAAVTRELPKWVPQRVLRFTTYPGESTPIGAREYLAGRQNIIISEWGPWDHESPYAQLVDKSAGQHLYALHNFPSDLALELSGEGIELNDEPGKLRHVRLTSSGEGVFAYSLQIGEWTVKGVIEHIEWDIRAFACPFDPREDHDAWKALLAAAAPTERRSLDLPYAMGGPQALGLPVTGEPANNHFGTLGTTRVSLPAGQFELKSTSDDGIRVWVDGKLLIDNWTWHAPAENRAQFELTQAREVALRVEHFELDGYATLQVTLTPL